MKALGTVTPSRWWLWNFVERLGRKCALDMASMCRRASSARCHHASRSHLLCRGLAASAHRIVARLSHVVASHDRRYCLSTDTAQRYLRVCRCVATYPRARPSVPISPSMLSALSEITLVALFAAYLLFRSPIRFQATRSYNCFTDVSMTSLTFAQSAVLPARPLTRCGPPLERVSCCRPNDMAQLPVQAAVTGTQVPLQTLLSLQRGAPLGWSAAALMVSFISSPFLHFPAFSES